jgi:hypothetical protein
MRSENFLRGLLDVSKRVAAEDPTTEIDEGVRQLEKKKDRAARLALRADAADTFLGLVSERSRQVDALRREAQAIRLWARLLSHKRRDGNHPVLDLMRRLIQREFVRIALW